MSSLISAAAGYKLAGAEAVLGANKRAKVEIFASVEALSHPALGVVLLVVIMWVLRAIDKALEDMYGTYPGLFSAGAGGKGA
ncbi:hypothetical protein H0H87_006759 [Tephrocybe sp. NHM501043]|nr:hypothetical protein H0H87_006759 [Tephrocybe sp. NHM501043]